MKALLAALLLLATPSTPAGTGPFPAVMETEPTLPTHTVYRPADLAHAGKLPVLVWGNGGCRNLGNSAANFLTEIASHGYLVVAAGEIGEVAPPRPNAGELRTDRPGDADGVWRPQTNTNNMIQAIDWAIAENGRTGSPFRGRIDTRRIAVAGHSCGGLMALAASKDKRVTTSMIMNSGALNDGTHPQGIEATKAALGDYHGPVLYVTGGPKDVAYPNASDDVGRIKGITVVHVDRDTGHGGTYREANGGAYADLALAWLDWQLKGNAAAGQAFAPEGKIGSDPAWRVLARRLAP